MRGKYKRTEERRLECMVDQAKKQTRVRSCGIMEKLKFYAKEMKILWTVLSEEEETVSDL
jgi:hypothetical protein